MDYSLAFKCILILTTVAGTVNVIIPLITTKRSVWHLACMLLISACYIISVIIIGIFYVKTGATNFSLLDLGKFSLKFHLEPLGLIFLSLLSVLWFVSIIYTHGYLEYLGRDNKIQVWISLCVIVTSLVAMSANIFTMFVFYEILTFCTIPLIYKSPNHLYKNCDSGENDRYSALLTQYLRPLLYPSILLFLPAVIYICSSEDISSNVAMMLSLLCIFGVSKTALVPFHTWLPVAMIAPHPVSALFHGVAIVNAGIFVICKILFYELHITNAPLGSWLIAIPATTIIYSGIQALRATDIKQILAYSTISQLAICLVGVLLLSKAGIISAIIFILAHSFAKIALFFIAGNIYLMLGITKLQEMRGLLYTMPGSVILFVLSSLSLIGTPFIAGGIGKSAIISAASECGSMSAFFLVILGSIITCVYLGRVVYVFCCKNNENHYHAQTTFTPIYRALLFAPVVLCIIVVYGFFILEAMIEKLVSFI